VIAPRQPTESSRQLPAKVRRRARALGLVYTLDGGVGLRRRGRPGRFYYTDARGRKVTDRRALARIRSLAIPPAWADVWINANPRGHLQACGRDARGRKQYRYHTEWRELQESAKFGQLVAFARALPRLRRAVSAALRRSGLDAERMTAVVVRLLETSLIRVGNEEYARSNRSFGLTTLQDRHAAVTRRGICFEFAGKSGIDHRIVLADAELARLVRRTQELPGQQLFQYVDSDGRRHKLRSNDVNAFIRRHSGGDFTAKHFRTWAGTVLMALELAQQPPPETKRLAQKYVMVALRAVAERLGNTPAVARRSYVHPAVIDAYAAGSLPRLSSSGPWPPVRPPNGLTRRERAVLQLLERAERRSTRNGSTPGGSLQARRRTRGERQQIRALSRQLMHALKP
jgi:DNA topoisomerase-1